MGPVRRGRRGVQGGAPNHSPTQAARGAATPAPAGSPPRVPPQAIAGALGRVRPKAPAIATVDYKPRGTALHPAPAVPHWTQQEMKPDSGGKRGGDARSSQGARIRAPERAPRRRRTGGRVFGVGVFGVDKVGGDRFSGEIRGARRRWRDLLEGPEEGAVEGQGQVEDQGSVVRGEGAMRHSSVRKEGQLGREVQRRPTKDRPGEPPPQARGPSREQGPVPERARPPPPLAPASRRQAPSNSQPQPRNEPLLTITTLPPFHQKTTTKNNNPNHFLNNHKSTTTNPIPQPTSNPTSIQLNPLPSTAEDRHTIVNVFGQPRKTAPKPFGKPGGCGRRIRAPVRSIWLANSPGAGRIPG